MLNSKIAKRSFHCLLAKKTWRKWANCK